MVVDIRMIAYVRMVVDIRMVAYVRMVDPV